MKTLTTPCGREYLILGEASVVTTDRLSKLVDRLDSDPRITSVSVVHHPDPGQEFLRASAPAGCAVLVASDIAALAGDVPGDADELALWARRATERGLWHDWWLTPAKDIADASEFIAASELDEAESVDLASSRYAALMHSTMDPRAITMTIDVTWLGPHQTGAQVLTTAAIEALARNPAITRLFLIGVDELPEYASHLAELDKVRVRGVADEPLMSDVIWYPNQIDQRVDITHARSLGRRVITTYLDLIAYDIPRYHASPEAWATYRSLQRRIALSVDGITTISQDVAYRLAQEVPRLDPERVQPIPLGLDHIAPTSDEPGDDTASLRGQLGNRPFVLVLGNDFLHKNRDFALRVWEEVLEQGVNCDLVLAGLHVKSSSSRDAEQTLLTQHTSLRGDAHTVGHVSPGSRAWLLANAAAVLYPSSAEGFGFVPYEAAALGTPSTFTAFGPLAELTGVTDAPRAWWVPAYAEDLRSLLTDAEAARERVNALRASIATLTWDLFAERLINFVQCIDRRPPVEGALLGGTEGDGAALAAILGSRTWRATAPFRRLGRRITRS